MDHNPMDTYGFLRSVLTITLEYRGYVTIRAEDLHKRKPHGFEGLCNQLLFVMIWLGKTTMKKNAPFVASFLMAGCWFVSFCTTSLVSAEMYVAGQAGVNFADRINSVAGTGGQAGVQGPLADFDLQNSITYGGKIGYFPGHSWYGIEAEAFHTTPHIKSFDDDPTTSSFDPDTGANLRITTVGVNFIARYPGRTLQPYVGVGVGAAIARIGDSIVLRSDTDVATAWNVLVGLRAFVTSNIAIFTEYKYTGATFKFDQALPPDAGFSGNYRAQHILGGLSYHF
jgi:opacity protein-like surface antigen